MMLGVEQEGAYETPCAACVWGGVLGILLGASLTSATPGTMSRNTTLTADHVSNDTVDPKRMVLRLSDLPTGFALDHAYYADNVRAAKESQTPLALLVRWGRINGYQVDYARAGNRGILHVRSVASRYGTAKGAADSLHYAFSEAGRVFTGTRIGTESRMYTATVNSQAVPVVGYAVFWRSRTVKAGIVAAGVKGTVRATDAVALARKQQARIAIAGI